MEDTSVTENINRRKFSIPWLLYLLFFLLIYITGLISTISDQKLFDWIDLLISTPSLVALALYTFKKGWGSETFWKIYSIVFPIYDISKNVLVDPLFRGKPFSIESAIGGVIIVPLYIALILFAFKSRKKQIGL